MTKGPDFIIIGAMKCATSSLHEQLAQQPGFYMSEPKEPNFFSNDEIYDQGMDWYLSLFQDASETALKGESSTHYTKLPTYPKTIERLSAAFPGVKLIYIMRHPIDRLISQYIHEWTQKIISVEINQAIGQYPELIQYSLYSLQLKPYLETFGPENILPVFFERLYHADYSQSELERICQFLGYDQTPAWRDLDAQNVSSERLRQDALFKFLDKTPAIQFLRRKFIPKTWRDSVRRLWTLKKKPEISADLRQQLTMEFNQDLAILGQWLGMEINCDNFKTVVRSEVKQWVNPIDLTLGAKIER